MRRVYPHRLVRLTATKPGAAQRQIRSNYFTLNTRGVYALFSRFCFNLGTSQIGDITDSCNYKEIVKQDYWLMLHIAYGGARGGRGGDKKEIPVVDVRL